MRINHNIAALNTYNQLSQNNKVQQQSLEKLSSGLRINSAADDAAGLAISEKMRGQIQGLEMASKNAQDGISLIQTAEGSLNESHSILQRMRELAVQSANDTNTEEDRAEIQEEVDKLAQELTRIGNNTEFNTQKLLDGDFEGTFHIGANESQNISMSISDMRAENLGVTSTDGFEKELSVTESTVSISADGLAVTDGESYDIYELNEDEVTDIKDGSGNTITVKYAMLDSNDEVVGVSEEGKEWHLSTNTDTIDNLDNISEDFATTTFNFGDPVTSGEMDVADDGSGVKVTGTAQIEFEDVTLDTGTYETVSSSNHELVGGSYNYGLKDSDGNIVALTEDDAATQTWVSVEDTNDVVFEIGGDDSNILTGGDTIDVTIDGGIDVSSQSAADSAISVIDNAIAEVSSERSKLGAYQNRLEHTINNLGTAAENLTAAESRIRDVDYAEAA